MPFSTATILPPGPQFELDGSSLVVFWESSSPAGTIFQLYVDRRLTWHGTSRFVSLPPPGDRAIFQVGTVDAGEENIDFSADLPLLQGTGDKAALSWRGGSWQEPTGPGSGLAGFRIFGETTPGGGIGTTPIGEVPAYAPGLETDGFGLGGYGEGGYGAATATYFWKSGVLANGTWNFMVSPIDHAGNLGTGRIYAVTISNPPQPPPRNESTGNRLELTYSKTTGKATLTWLPSPG